VKVLKAVETITPGETMQQAQAAGKIAMGTVSRAQALEGATTTTAGMTDQVALTTIYPNEQIVSAKFGDPGEQEVLNIPDGKLAISVNLSDPARVAGFLTPGAQVAIFVSGTPEAETGNTGRYTRLLLPRVQVIGVGTTTVVSTTKTDPEGAQTTEQLPRTLLTMAVDQRQAERILFAAGSGEMSFALLTDKSTVTAGPGVTASDIFK
jgi:pilus assembly protein CpaB